MQHGHKHTLCECVRCVSVCVYIFHGRNIQYYDGLTIVQHLAERYIYLIYIVDILCVD